MAAPTLLEQLPARPVPADLSALPSLHWGRPQRDYHWELVGPDAVHASLRYQPRLVTDDLLVLRQAAVAGVGVVHVPLVVVRNELASGKLVKVTPDWAPECGVVHAVFASRRGLLPGVRSLLDFLATGFEASDIS